MRILKGKGSTFSTSGKHWNPFRGNRTVGAQNAKRARLVKAGIGGNMSKEHMRELASQAAQSSPVRTMPAGKRTVAKPNAFGE